MTADTTARLDQLESRLRRQQVISVFSLLLATLALVWGWKNQPSATATTIEAERFVLKDSKGNQRGVWEIGQSNEPSFQIGTQDYADIFLGMTSTGPRLTLMGNPHAASLSAGKGSARLSLWGEPNRPFTNADFDASTEEQAMLAGDFCTLSSHSTQFFMQSKTGLVAMDAGHGNSYGPWMNFNKEGKTRHSLGKGSATGNTWRLTFKNPDGTTNFHETPPTAPPN